MAPSLEYHTCVHQPQHEGVVIMISLDAIGGEHGHACTSSNRERRQKIEMAIILDEIMNRAKVEMGAARGRRATNKLF